MVEIGGPGRPGAERVVGYVGNIPTRGIRCLRPGGTSRPIARQFIAGVEAQRCDCVLKGRLKLSVPKCLAGAGISLSYKKRVKENLNEGIEQ